MISIPTFTENV